MGLFDPPSGNANPFPDPPAPSAVLDAVIEGGEAVADGASDAASDVAGDVTDAVSDAPTPKGVTFDPPSNPVDFAVPTSPPGADSIPHLDGVGEMAGTVLEAAPTPVIDVDLDPQNHSAAIDVGVKGGDVEFGDTANVSLDHGTLSVDDGRYLEVNGERTEIGVTSSAQDGGVFDIGVYAEVDDDRTEVGVTATRPLVGRTDEGVYVENGDDRTEVGLTNDQTVGVDGAIGSHWGPYEETSDGGRDQTTIYLQPAAPSPLPVPDNINEHDDPGEGAAADPPSFEAQAVQEVAIVTGTVAEVVERVDDAGLPTPDADDPPGPPTEDTADSSTAEDDDSWDTTADGAHIDIDFGEPVEALEELPDLDDTVNPDIPNDAEPLTPPEDGPDGATEPSEDPSIDTSDPSGSDGAIGDGGTGEPEDSGLLDDVGDAIGGVVDTVGDAISDLFD